MAITLEDVKLNAQDHLYEQVIDTFAKKSYLLDHMIFDDAVSATGGTLTYNYDRVTQPAKAATRQLGTEYTAQEAKKERVSNDLKIIGSKFDIDRVLARAGGIVKEVTFQMDQAIKATKKEFSNIVINGDTGTNGFDGLSKLLKGKSQELKTEIDLSTSELVTSNYLAFLDMLDEMISGMDGEPSMIFGNTKMLAKVRACARRASMYQTKVDTWGNQIEYYGKTPLVDLGEKTEKNDPIIATNTQDGKSDLYAVRIGLDGFHAASMAGDHPIRLYMPNFKDSGAVKSGEVELVTTCVLKSMKAAAVLRGVKITAGAGV